MASHPSSEYAEQFFRRPKPAREAEGHDSADRPYAERFLGQSRGADPRSEPDPVAEPQAAPVETDTNARPTLRALGSQLTLSSRMQRWLRGNERELANLEGNLAASGKAVKRLWVTSAFDGEGKTTAAFNAALGLLRAGRRRVLLVDGNPGRPAVASWFEARPTPGLREVLGGEVSVEMALRPSQHPGLDVMMIGDGWQSLGQKLPPMAMRQFLDIVADSYDFIVIDGSSTYGSSDTSQVGVLCDGAILAATCEQTKWEVLQGAADHVRSLGIDVLGVVLNQRRFYIPSAIYNWLAR